MRGEERVRRRQERESEINGKRGRRDGKRERSS